MGKANFQPMAQRAKGTLCWSPVSILSDTTKSLLPRCHSQTELIVTVMALVICVGEDKNSATDYLLDSIPHISLICFAFGKLFFH